MKTCKKKDFAKKTYKIKAIKIVKNTVSGTCCFVNTYKTQ